MARRPPAPTATFVHPILDLVGVAPAIGRKKDGSVDVPETEVVKVPDDVAPAAPVHCPIAPELPGAPMPPTPPPLPAPAHPMMDNSPAQVRDDGTTQGDVASMTISTDDPPPTTTTSAQNPGVGIQVVTQPLEASPLGHSENPGSCTQVGTQPLEASPLGRLPTRGFEISALDPCAADGQPKPTAYDGGGDDATVTAKAPPRSTEGSDDSGVESSQFWKNLVPRASHATCVPGVGSRFEPGSNFKPVSPPAERLPFLQLFVDDNLARDIYNGLAKPQFSRIRDRADVETLETFAREALKMGMLCGRLWKLLITQLLPLAPPLHSISAP